MTSRVLISGRTGTGSANLAISEDTGPMTVFATGLDAGEEIAVQISPDEGVTPADLYQNGSRVVLSATHNALEITACGYYTLSKPVTVGGVVTYVSHRLAI